MYVCEFARKITALLGRQAALLLLLTSKLDLLLDPPCIKQNSTRLQETFCYCRHRWQYGWSLTLWFNNIIIVCTLVFGMGFGMWASFQTLMSNVGEFGVFAACYNCS